MKKDKKQSKSDLKDIVIKAILIVIIILLLLRNCSIIKKRGVQQPSGNVNIIEITCNNKDTCTSDKNKKTDQKPKDNEIVVSENKKTSRKNNTHNKSSNNMINESSSYKDNYSKPEENKPAEPVLDEDEKILVEDNKIEWSQNSQLAIFTNSYYNFEDKIAPESSNTYKFVVKNSTKYNIKYDISFTQTNPYHMNMKYRLKKNNTYIVGNYVPYNELNITNQLLSAKKEDTFYLDWKWFSSDNDNAAGENSANYKLSILVKAESTSA